MARESFQGPLPLFCHLACLKWPRIQTPGKGRLNKTAYGIEIILAHPLEEEDKTLRKQWLFIQNFKYLFKTLLWISLPLFDNVTNHLAIFERDQNPSADFSLGEEIVWNSIKEGFPHGECNSNSEVGSVFVSQWSEPLGRGPGIIRLLLNPLSHLAGLQG